MRPKRPNCPWQSARTTRGAGVDGVRRVRHGGAHAAPAAVPHHAREAQLRAAERRRQPGCVVAVVGVGGEAVEVVRREAGVRRGSQDRLAGELELAAVRDPAPRPVLRLADAGDGDLVAHGRGASPPPRAGVNRGRQLPATSRPDYTGGMSLPSRAELEAIAARAGARALQHFRRVTAERKADRSLVTAADREVEAASSPTWARSSPTPVSS